MDRRAAERHSVAMIVRVEFGFTSIKGVVLDLSRTGARIHIDAAVQVPEVITLRLLDLTPRAACLRWRRGNEAGFEFLPSSGLGAGRRRNGAFEALTQNGMAVAIARAAPPSELSFSPAPDAATDLARVPLLQ